MSFARLLSRDAGVGEPASGDANVDEKPADSRKAGLHDAAKRMVHALHAKDHEGVSAALEDWHEIRDSAGLQDEPKPPQVSDDEV